MKGEARNPSPSIFLPPLNGEGPPRKRRGWGARETMAGGARSARRFRRLSRPFSTTTPEPHPSRLRRATLPIEGRERRRCSEIVGNERVDHRNDHHTFSRLLPLEGGGRVGVW